jgi:ComF family protein
MLKDILDLLFPPRCIACSKPGQEIICGECLRQINYLKPPICSVCGKPKDRYFQGALCEDCSKNKPAFTLARSVALYEGVLKEAIHKFKFNCKKGLSDPLGRLIAEHLKGSDIPIRDIDIVIPIPLSRQRERERGYNQSMLLAEVVSREFQVKLDVTSLKKIKDIKPQFELARAERLVNIKGAFVSCEISNLNVLVIDDIYTTGATVSEAVSALKVAGAKNVYVLTLARAVED